MQYESTLLRPTTQDLTNKSYNRWTVMHFAGYRKRHAYWTCQCRCGTIKDVGKANLVTGISQSCGCRNTELIVKRSTTHGLRHVPEYTVWKTMRQRCHNPRSQGYAKYGARGITVCDAWQNFATFYADMGPRPSPHHSIERLRNEEGYTPENCIWATPAIQSRNTRQNVMLTYNDVTQCATDWARQYGINPQRFRERIREGWSIEEALFIPIEGKHHPLKRHAFHLSRLFSA